MGELSRSIFISPEAAQKYYAAGQDVGVPYGGFYPGQKFKEPAFQRQVASLEEWLLIAYKEGVLVNDDWVVQQVPDRAVLVYWDMMDEDPDVFAACETLVGGVAKVPLKIKPCDDSGDANELSEFIKFALDRIDIVTMLQEIAHGEFTGYSVFEIVYEEARWRGRKVLVPARGVRINESKIVFDYFNRPKLITLHNPIIGAFFAPSGKYITYKRGSRPYGDALLKHAFQPYWYKRNGVMALAQLIERFGVPPIFARHTNDIEAANNIRMLQSLRSQGIGSLPRGLAGENPLSVLEPGGTSSMIMDRAMQFFKDEIFRAILGGTRQMSDSDDAGAYSATEVHADQTADRQQSILRRLKFVVNDQLIPGIIRLNFGVCMTKVGNTYVRGDHPLPRASFEHDDQESPDDYMNRVTSWRQAGIKALPISKSQFYRKTGFEAPTDSNDTILPSSAQMPGGNLPTDMSEMKDSIVGELKEFFNENHDEIGRFTFGNSGGEKKSATSSKELHTKDGKYTDERQALHDKIVEHLMGTATAVAHPTVTILGGGTASGKSTLVKSGELNIENAAKIDPDEIKAMIPEFGQKVAAGEHNAAAYVHEESSDVSQQAMVTALDRHLNVVLDGTGDGGYPKLEARIDSYREHGADRIVAEYVTRPVSEALERSHTRGEETGRHVPDQVLRDSHSSVAKIFPQAVRNGLFNEARLWDNTGGKGIPKKIFEHKNGKSSIYDESRYNTFLKKADDQ